MEKKITITIPLHPDDSFKKDAVTISGDSKQEIEALGNEAFSSYEMLVTMRDKAMLDSGKYAKIVSTLISKLPEDSQTKAKQWVKDQVSE